jgi:hypothetical protein
MASKNLEMFRKFAFIVDNPSTASRVHGLTPTLKMRNDGMLPLAAILYICSTAKNRKPH